MKLLLFIILALAPCLQGSPFQAVFVTDEDAAKLGGFPLPRRHLAEALYAAKRAGAQAVILKFFLDQPGKIPKDDAALAAAIKDCGLKVVLQARLDETEKKSNPLAAKFIRAICQAPEGTLQRKQRMVAPAHPGRWRVCGGLHRRAKSGPRR
ncbi:MAG: CHASE2 domain-containing protein [Opitutaceae bacterium]|nr:CHASE2 domain-containing protein [Opitutaceae bacterium]